MAIELKCDVTGTKTDVAEALPASEYAQQVDVNGHTCNITVIYGWGSEIQHVSKAARATALRKAAAAMTKAGAGQGKKAKPAEVKQPPEPGDEK